MQNDVSSTCCGHVIYLFYKNAPLLCNVHSLPEFDELFEGLSRRFGANLSSAKYIFSQVHSDSASKPRLAGDTLSDMTKQDRAKTLSLIEQFVISAICEELRDDKNIFVHSFCV